MIQDAAEQHFRLLALAGALPEAGGVHAIYAQGLGPARIGDGRQVEVGQVHGALWR
ncbi:hypothetical protein [Chromobacterium phragmitis]|uniref:Uncharacterized protein n=1 Tax=Chromobacterium phragmitis TaxID=2202141 RepID=A0ABV0IYD1_9NEIS|nr:hypothetical protein [Chromobacterium phragmitis]